MHKLQRLQSKIKKQIHNMAFQSIPKFKIGVSPLRLFSMSWSYVLTCTAPTPAVCFAAIWHTHPPIPFFQKEKHILTSTNAIFNITTYTHPFCTFNKKKPLKMGMQ